MFHFNFISNGVLTRSCD